MMRAGLVIAVGGILASGLLAGCGSAPSRTTQYTAEDAQRTSVELRQQLADSAWLAGRTPQSPEIWLLPDELTNASNERLTEGDRWAIIGRALFDPGMQQFLRQRSVWIIMPPERLPGLRQAGVDVPPTTSRAATHFLRGSFRSATRTGSTEGRRVSDVRTDTFLIDLTALEADSGRAVWTGTHEFKRFARGSLAD